MPVDHNFVLPDGETYSAEELAKLLSLEKSALLAFEHAGLLGFSYSCGERRYSRDDVMRLVAALGRNSLTV